MTHPITPPPELVKELQDLGNLDSIALAYQAGADHELEACSGWLALNGYGEAAGRLRVAMRPKPPSLKERIAAAIADGDKRTALSLLNKALPNG